MYLLTKTVNLTYVMVATYRKNYIFTKKMQATFNFIPMKKFLFAMPVLVGAALSSYGQFMEITALGGYTLGETFNSVSAYQVYIHDGATYGGSLAYYPDEHYDFAITYTRQSTKLDFYDYYSSGYATDVPVSVNYIMIGGDRNQVIGPNGTSLFGGLNLGTVGLEPKESKYNGIWKFAFDVHVGAKIFLSEIVGLRLQAGINFPVQYFGAAFTLGGAGSGASVSATGSVTQVNFLGGLIIRLPSKK